MIEIRCPPDRVNFRVHIGSGTKVMSDGTDVWMNDIVHTWIPIRDEPDLSARDAPQRFKGEAASLRLR